MSVRELGALALLALAPIALVAQQEALIPFQFEDQFGARHSDMEFRGQVLVLLAGDREGSRHTKAWKDALRTALAGAPGAERVRFAGLADLGGVPRFLRGAVKARFPKEPERWVLLDWEGLFMKAYGLERGGCTVLVFGPDGRLIFRTCGRKPDPKAVETTAAAVRSSAQSLKEAP